MQAIPGSWAAWPRRVAADRPGLRRLRLALGRIGAARLVLLGAFLELGWSLFGALALDLRPGRAASPWQVAAWVAGVAAIALAVAVAAGHAEACRSGVRPSGMRPPGME
jgi:hypothetical protein